jgi:hypothetical protein
MERHGDLLQVLADCPKARSASIHSRCKAVFSGLDIGKDYIGVFEQRSRRDTRR